jgi:hypothetical protein
MAKAGGGTALVNIQAELKKQAGSIKERIQAPSGDMIRVTQDKQFKLPDGQTSAGPLNLVILDFVALNQFFDRPYKEGEKIPAACMAIGPNPRNMAPVKESPIKQSDDCQTCANNEFGTNGAGKACSNQRLLAVVEPNDNPDSPIFLLKVSPTGIKAFDGFVSSISTQFESLPISVETEVYFEPSLKYPSLRFGNPKPNKNLAIHYARIKDAQARLNAIPDMSGYTAPPKGAKKR